MNTLATDGERCLICGGLLTFDHDHKPDQSGLDDGPPIERPYTRRAPPKTPEELTEIRARAWKTRRAKYGRHGHR